MDIHCPSWGSDYIEMRDGKNDYSPLMRTFCGSGSNVLGHIQTIQNFLRIRFPMENYMITCHVYNDHELIYRFSSNYFESGLGFQLEYESITVSQWTFRSGICGGNFSTQNGIFTSPSYPNNYPHNSDCIYIISQPAGRVILLNFLSMDIKRGYTWDINCQHHDYLQIKDGPSDDSPLLSNLCCYECGSEIPAPIQSSQNQLWMMCVKHFEYFDVFIFSPVQSFYSLNFTFHSTPSESFNHKFQTYYKIHFRFHSGISVNDKGFQIEYNTKELYTECGGNYSNASGALSSPSLLMIHI